MKKSLTKIIDTVQSSKLDVDVSNLPTLLQLVVDCSGIIGVNPQYEVLRKDIEIFSRELVYNSIHICHSRLLGAMHKARSGQSNCLIFLFFYLLNQFPVNMQGNLKIPRLLIEGAPKHIGGNSNKRRRRIAFPSLTLLSLAIMHSQSVTHSTGIELIRGSISLWYHKEKKHIEVFTCK